MDDSRCPEGVQCIWAGRLAYQLELESCGKSERFTLIAPSGPGHAHTSLHVLASAPSMKIMLAPVPAAPRGAGFASPVTTVDVVVAAD